MGWMRCKSLSSRCKRSSNDGDACADSLCPLQQFRVLGLELGNALVVLCTLLDHVRQRPGALVEILGDIVQRHALGQQHFARAADLRPVGDQVLFDPRDAGQLLAHLRNASPQGIAVADARPFGFTLRSQARLHLLVEQHDHFTLELLQRLLDLREARQLGLGAGQAALQILDAPRLFLFLDGHALQALVESRDLFAVAAMLFVQPGHHLAELGQIHGG